MPILVDKLLTVFALPLGTSLALAAIGFVCLVVGGRRSGGVLLTAGFAWLWLCSTPVVAHRLQAPLQDAFPARLAEAMPTADAIVLLGGSLDAPGDDLPYPDLRRSADRVWHAARLYRAGRAPVVIVAGGQVWGGGRASEARETQRLLADLGVPEDAVVLETTSRNTRQNALNSVPILAERRAERILLVTSATHMRRALGCFTRLGVNAVPAATDHGVPGSAPAVLGWLPHAWALEATSAALHEYLGLLVYRLRGWI